MSQQENPPNTETPVENNVPSDQLEDVDQGSDVPEAAQDALTIQPSFCALNSRYQTFDEFKTKVEEYATLNGFLVSRDGEYFRCHRSGKSRGSNSQAVENGSSRTKKSLKCGCEWSVRVCFLSHQIYQCPRFSFR
jgi:hypothetical protein